MIQIFWAYIVKEEARGQFELAYGPGGAVSRLFARQPGFRGAMLLRDAGNPRRLLSVEIWDSEAQREQALRDQASAYADLLASLDGWTESTSDLGVFRVLAEATVQPVGKAARGRGGAGRRGDHPTFR